MQLPSEDRIAELLRPYVAGDKGSALQEVSLSATLLARLRTYLELLTRWNERVNLTAVRSPEAMVTRHFGESLLLARLVPPDAVSLLDLGSGAGFPGLPIQLALPQLRVTLAESQGKKAAFLREAVRVLGTETEIWADRAEGLVGDIRFDVVALRAVDNMGAAVSLARQLALRQLVLGVRADLEHWGLRVRQELAVPGSSAGSIASLCGDE